MHCDTNKDNFPVKTCKAWDRQGYSPRLVVIFEGLRFLYPAQGL